MAHTKKKEDEKKRQDDDDEENEDAQIMDATKIFYQLYKNKNVHFLGAIKM